MERSSLPLLSLDPTPGNEQIAQTLQAVYAATQLPKSDTQRVDRKSLNSVLRAYNEYLLSAPESCCTPREALALPWASLIVAKIGGAAADRGDTRGVNATEVAAALTLIRRTVMGDRDL